MSYEYDVHFFLVNIVTFKLQIITQIVIRLNLLPSFCILYLDFLVQLYLELLCCIPHHSIDLLHSVKQIKHDAFLCDLEEINIKVILPQTAIDATVFLKQLLELSQWRILWRYDAHHEHPKGNDYRIVTSWLQFIV